MLFRLIRKGEKITFQPFMKRSASELLLTEKELENWMAENPELLFGGERVLVISQSVAGQSMADILALDAEGKLIIVEIKRDWSNRATVGQLLEYAAGMSESSYEQLERLHRDYWERHHSGKLYVSLIDQFRQLTDDPTAEKKDIPEGHRVYIVAPGSDVGLDRIVKWLKGHGVPISFVPFTLYADTENDAENILLEMEQLPKIEPSSKVQEAKWQGDWLHNTNEKYAPGAYKKMFDQGRIAIYGYDDGPQRLTGTTKGEQVFAYVNAKGILAVGHIVDGQVFPCNSIFGKQKDGEFHVKVDWRIVVAEDKGVTATEVRQKFGYRPPIIPSMSPMYRHDVAVWIADELRTRG